MSGGLSIGELLAGEAGRTNPAREGAGMPRKRRAGRRPPAVDEASWRTNSRRGRDPVRRRARPGAVILAGDLTDGYHALRNCPII
jgi:hypothetical protein